MDVFLFQKFNDLAGGQGLFDGLVIFLASPFSYLVMAVLLVAFFLPNLFAPAIAERTFRIGLLAGLVSAFFARVVVKEIIVFFHDSPRPFEVLEGVNQIIAHGGMSSFPSGHAIFFFTLATVLMFYSRGLGIFLLLSSILMALSRVIAGIHWPSDVIAGASFGILIGILTYVLLAGYVISKKGTSISRVQE